MDKKQSSAFPGFSAVKRSQVSLDVSSNRILIYSVYPNVMTFARRA